MNISHATFAAVLTGAAVLLAWGGRTVGRIDAGGHRLRILRSGSGGPTVVFEAGMEASLETWVRIQPAVAKFTSTIAYDRAGNGLSDNGPEPRDGRQIATELHTMLQNAHAKAPYLLVAHSMGGPYVRIYSAMYPGEVAGIVLVDPTQEKLIDWAKARESKMVLVKPRPYRENDWISETFDEARLTQVPAGIPVALICGMGPRTVPDFVPQELRDELWHDHEVLYPNKLKFHREWLEKTPGGQLIVTENSGHGIPYEEPELVVMTIRDMVERIRAGPGNSNRR